MTQNNANTNVDNAMPI